MAGNCGLSILIADEGHLITWTDITRTLHILIDSGNS